MENSCQPPSLKAWRANSRPGRFGEVAELGVADLLHRDADDAKFRHQPRLEEPQQTRQQLAAGEVAGGLEGVGLRTVEQLRDAEVPVAVVDDDSDLRRAELVIVWGAAHLPATGSLRLRQAQQLLVGPSRYAWSPAAKRARAGA